MLVNVTHVEESRVAVLHDGVLAAYEIETINRTNIKGNIYNAVVDSVHPSLEAAFVKIGPDLNGFLPLDEVNFRLLPARTDSRKSGKIGQHLHPGQKLIVQVVREPFGEKPPTVSTYFSLPGRYLVLMPGVDSSGISRKIEDGAQRDRLRKIVEELSAPEGFGVIVRTAGMGQTKAELQRDLRYLLRLWEAVQRGSGETEFPGTVYREADLVIRTIRDHLTADIKEVWVDSEETYERAQAFARDVMPTRAKILKLYTGERPLFNKFNLEEQIERIYKRRVPLPSGGEVVIDGTEALTAVDVNSARSKRQGDADEIATKTNLEAAAEIARQLRLRDLGGLVVIDFIDMLATRNKKKVEKAMRDAMKGDRAKYDVTTLSKLGLMELARQRLKGAKMAASYATCHVCDGHGLIKNVETAALAALRKIQTRSPRGDVGGIRVSLPPDVATWLLNNKRQELSRIEQRIAMPLQIEPRSSMLRHEIEFETLPRQQRDDEPAAEAPAPAKAAPKPAPAKVAAKPAEEKLAAKPAEEKPATAASEESPTNGRPRRRKRRRRRGRGGAAASAEPNGPEAESKTKEPPAKEAAVPRNVNSDELMPAASGGRSRRRSRSGNRQRG